MNKYYILKFDCIKNDPVRTAIWIFLKQLKKSRKFKISRRKRRFIRLDRAVRQSNAKFKGYITRKRYIDAERFWYKSKKKCLTSFDFYQHSCLELTEEPTMYKIFEPTHDNTEV